MSEKDIKQIGLGTVETVSHGVLAHPDQPVKVVICIPSQDMISAGFMFDLVAMIAALRDCPNLQLQILNNRGTILPQQRTNLVKLALESNPTHLLFLDADMRFPVDTLLRLLAHRKAVVAANYSTRRAPIIPTSELEEGYMFPVDVATEGLVDVKRCGMGVMLIDATLFGQIKKPWFATGWDRTGDFFVGEDVFFCRQVQAVGEKVWVDLALSNEVEHLGEFAYKLRHTLVTLEHTKQQQAQGGEPNDGSE